MTYGLYIKDYVNGDGNTVIMRLRELEEDGKPVSCKTQKEAQQYLAKYHLKYIHTPFTIEHCEVLIIPQIVF